MSDTQTEINELLRVLDPKSRMRPQWNPDDWELLTPGTACIRYHAALTALVAERDDLKRRVEVLEAQPQPSSERDLRERLVCAALSGACGLANPPWSSPKHLANEVVRVAEETLAAMRREGGGA